MSCTFPGHGSNPSHSSDPSHRSDRAGSLTCWAIRELLDSLKDMKAMSLEELTKSTDRKEVQGLRRKPMRNPVLEL